MDMATGREEVLFLAFKRQPSSETLTALLRSHQDHIYNICFQVLRHPEDAEDVSQEVLLEVTKGISKVEAPRQFKVWLYRVALHSSLNLKQARARRVELARRVAVMPLTEGAPVDPEERAALMRAIGDLDDPSRCMLIEHYFDKLTLEEIGAREGVSAVAVFKRLDRARETLRRALIGAGFTAAGAGVAHSLESVTPVVAPAGLVGKAALAGGITVGTKSALTAGGIIAALLLIGATAGGGYFIGGTFAPKRRPPALEVPPMAAETARQTAAISKSAIPNAPPTAKPEMPAAESGPEPDWNAIAEEAFDLNAHIRRGRLPPNKMQWSEMYARLKDRALVRKEIPGSARGHEDRLREGGSRGGRTPHGGSRHRHAALRYQRRTRSFQPPSRTSLRHRSS